MKKAPEPNEPEAVILPNQTEGEKAIKSPKPEKHDPGKCGDCENVA